MFCISLGKFDPRCDAGLWDNPTWRMQIPQDSGANPYQIIQRAVQHTPIGQSIGQLWKADNHPWWNNRVESSVAYTHWRTFVTSKGMSCLLKTSSWHFSAYAESRRSSFILNLDWARCHAKEFCHAKEMRGIQLFLANCMSALPCRLSGWCCKSNLADISSLSWQALGLWTDEFDLGSTDTPPCYVGEYCIRELQTNYKTSAINC